MPTYTVTADRLPNLFRERMAERRARVLKAIQDTVLTSGPGLAVVQTQAGTARLRPPIDRATYLRGWQARKLENGAVLYNDTAVAAIIERGRRPGKFPPLRLIFEWVRRKRIGATFTGPVQATYGPRQRRGRVRTDRQNVVEDQQWRIALSIARAIKARGLPAHRIMAKTKRKLDKQVQRAVRDALGF